MLKKSVAMTVVLSFFGIVAIVSAALANVDGPQKPETERIAKAEKPEVQKPETQKVGKREGQPGDDRGKDAGPHAKREAQPKDDRGKDAGPHAKREGQPGDDRGKDAGPHA